MTRKEIDKLRGQQTDQQKQLDTAREEGERLAKAEEPIPTELQDRATKARDAVVSIGEQITEAELAFARSIEQNHEFLSSLAPKVRDTTIQSQGADGIPQQEVTRETVDTYLQGMRGQYGSSLRDVPQRYQIDPESERLVLDMLRCANDQFPARVGEFSQRRARIAAKSQLRHSSAVTSGGTDQGGYTVPDDNTFMREVQLAELAHGGIVNVARVITTQGGRPLPIPTLDDTAATGAANIAENAALTDVDLTFGETSLGAHMMTSGRLSATTQAIEDAGPNLPMLLGMLAMERITRLESTRFMNGTGTGNQPQGAEVAFAVLGFTLLYDMSQDKYLQSASSTVAGEAPRSPWQDFIDIKYSVNAAYRSNAEVQPGLQRRARSVLRACGRHGRAPGVPRLGHDEHGARRGHGLRRHEHPQRLLAGDACPDHSCEQPPGRHHRRHELVLDSSRGRDGDDSRPVHERGEPGDQLGLRASVRQQGAVQHGHESCREAGAARHRGVVMSNDAIQDRYDSYRDANGLFRRPLPGNVRHLFDQTTERDASTETTRDAVRDASESGVGRFIDKESRPVTSTSAPVPNSPQGPQKAKRAR